jgi:3-hydroxyacyl-CoA dehydrogenase
MWDAAGVAATVSRMKALGLAGQPARRGSARRRSPDPGTPATAASVSSRSGTSSSRRPSPATPASPTSAAPTGRPLQPGASLVDLGDGIGCIELHSLKNAIGGDVLALVSSVLNPASDAVRDFAGFVIASDRENFSVGANLMQLLLAAQEASGRSWPPSFTASSR